MKGRISEKYVTVWKRSPCPSLLSVAPWGGKGSLGLQVIVHTPGKVKQEPGGRNWNHGELMLSGLFLLTAQGLYHQSGRDLLTSINNHKNEHCPSPRHTTGIIKGTITLNNVQESASESGARHRGSRCFYYLYCSEAGINLKHVTEENKVDNLHL